MTDRRPPHVHSFASTGEAYDASQCDDGIADGDVLYVPSERVVGVMVEAWPTAVTDEAGAFHALGEGFDWPTLDGGKYVASVAVARAVMTAPGILDAEADEPKPWPVLYDDDGVPVECLDGPGDCEGPVTYVVTADRSDGRAFPRCNAHADKRHAEASRNLELMSDTPPAWFDPTYAGERWSDDD